MKRVPMNDIKKQNIFRHAYHVDNSQFKYIYCNKHMINFMMNAFANKDVTFPLDMAIPASHKRDLRINR